MKQLTIEVTKLLNEVEYLQGFMRNEYEEEIQKSFKHYLDYLISVPSTKILKYKFVSFYRFIIYGDELLPKKEYIKLFED